MKSKIFDDECDMKYDVKDDDNIDEDEQDEDELDDDGNIDD